MRLLPWLLCGMLVASWASWASYATRPVDPLVDPDTDAAPDAAPAPANREAVIAPVNRKPRKTAAMPANLEPAKPAARPEPAARADEATAPAMGACPSGARPATEPHALGATPDRMPLGGCDAPAGEAARAGVLGSPAGFAPLLAQLQTPARTPTPTRDDAADAVPGGTASAASTRITALRIHGTRAIDVMAEGEAELQRDTLTLTADRLAYHEPSDEVVAEGNVRLRHGSRSRLSGSSATLVVGARTGEFQSPEYSITRVRPAREEGDPPREVTGGGKADTLHLEGENQYRARNATWSSCPMPHPAWYIRTGELELDYDREIGEARDSTLVFKDVPLFWMPWAEFPLAGQRHSGLLPPTIGSSNKTGMDLTVPYYWNIAPNYDFTFAPRYMSRRGLQLGMEARYRGASHGGTVRAEYLPHDNVSGEERSLGSLQHQQWLTPTLYGSIDLNGVSDDEYFEDLSSRVSLASKVNLLREARLMYVGGGWWNASAMAQSYQTLSTDPANVLLTPYRRLPQLTLNAVRPGEFGRPGTGFPGLDFAWQSEFTRFTHPRADHIDATRLIAYPQVSLPLQWSGFYITPKFGLHYSRYDLDRDRHVPGMRDEITRSVPILSVDSGLTFERDAHLFGRNYVQTLEPRLYYLRAAYRRQDDIPRFDTSRYDFSFAQIFNENLYTGGDRVADANQLTAAVTSRLIDPASGSERLRVLLGQRYYFKDQGVTLNYIGDPWPPVETARTSRRADLLAGISGQISRDSSIESLWQYNPRDYRTERYTATWRYNPGHARAFNLSYRYTRDILRDVDASGQWPLWGKWYGVARLTHSLKDDRLTEMIGGLEYDGGCWVMRVVAHRFATREDEVTTASFVQLELNDFTSIGNNPVNLIKRSVPGYGKINEPGAGRVFED